MRVGYARISAQDQNPDLQFDASRAAACEKVFVEKAFGAQRAGPQLQAALDRLARSLKQSRKVAP